MQHRAFPSGLPGTGWGFSGQLPFSGVSGGLGGMGGMPGMVAPSLPPTGPSSTTTILGSFQGPPKRI